MALKNLEPQVGMDHVMQQFVSIEDPEIAIAFQGHVPSVGDLMSCVDRNTFNLSGCFENLTQTYYTNYASKMGVL